MLSVDEISRLFCDACQYQARHKSSLYSHIKTMKHAKNVDAMEKAAHDQHFVVQKKSAHIVSSESSEDEVEKKYYCNICRYQGASKSAFKIHCASLKHQRMCDGQDYFKREAKFKCDVCKFSCFHNSHWSRHINTIRHQTLLVDQAINDLEGKTSVAYQSEGEADNEESPAIEEPIPVSDPIPIPPPRPIPPPVEVIVVPKPVPCEHCGHIPKPL